MPDSADPERETEQRRAAATAKHMLYQGHDRRRMRDMDRGQRRRKQIASRAPEVAEFVFRSCVVRLAMGFDHDDLLPGVLTGGERRVTSFGRPECFPASSKLEFAVRPDAENRRICVMDRLRILPFFFEFEREDQWVLSADVLDGQVANTWFERKNLQFIDTHPKRQENDAYPPEKLVANPVCGMRIKRSSVIGKARRQDRTYDFHLDKCRRSFLERSKAIGEAP